MLDADRTGAASPRLQLWVKAPPGASPDLSHPAGTMVAMRYRSTRKTVYSAKDHLIWWEFPRLRRLPVLWSPSWFVSTVGGAPLEVVRQYVENQKAVS